jgi:hypothetical protein
LQSGRQEGANKGVKKGPPAGGHLISIQSRSNVAGHAVGQGGKQSEQRKQQAKPISMMVELVTRAHHTALPFSMTSSMNASPEKIASRGRKRMVPGWISAKGVAIDLRIGCVNPASGLAIAMWI